VKPLRLALAGLLLVTLAGCAPAGARPVTTPEAETLAVVRLMNLTEGTREISGSVEEKGVELHLQGWIDYVSHAGYVSVTGAGFEAQALYWTEDRVGITTAEPDADGMPPIPVPDLSDESWTSRPLDAAGSSLDATLFTLGNLGSDRPENPLLLQQTGALWLREDSVGGVPVTVFAAPPSDVAREPSDPPVDPDDSPVRLWVNADGLALRVELRGTDDVWTTIDYGDKGPSLAVE